MFYSGSERKLCSEIANLFAEVPDTTSLNANIFISPHAGYIYSGLTASHLFARLQREQFKTVIVVSPSHQEYFRGVSVYPGSAYATPLGDVAIDKQKAKLLGEESKFIFFGEQGHRKEHGVEVQLPFLQYALGPFSFVPVVMGAQDEYIIDELAEKLALVMDADTALVVSSDLSHYHKKTVADKLDSRVASHLQSFSHAALYDELQRGTCEACGGGGIIAAMRVIEKIYKPNTAILHRSDSGDVTGDTAQVVGYLSASLN